MENKFTLENTKDATHYAVNKRGRVNFYNICSCGNSKLSNAATKNCWSDIGKPTLDLIDLTDQTGRGYPTLEWFLKCGFELEAGDWCIDTCGTEKEILSNSIARVWNTATSAGRIYVKSLHDNRHDLTMMARDEYYAKKAERDIELGKSFDFKVLPESRPNLTEAPEENEALDAIEKKQWPDSDRIDVIGQNGNNGEHYPHESESPLSPNFESKPVYTQEMHDNGELPPVGSECLCTFPASAWRGRVVKVYSHDVRSNDNVVLAGAEISSDANDGVTAAEFHQRFLKPIDTRTDEEKLRDAIDSELTEAFTVQWQADEQIDKLLNSDKFTITLNEEG